MQRAAKTRKHKPARITGLLAAAAALGCHRNHLYLVLNGRRKSASLLARYKALNLPA